MYNKKLRNWITENKQKITENTEILISETSKGKLKNSSSNCKLTKLKSESLNLGGKTE